MLEPTIVAESLVTVADPLVTALRPGPVAPGAQVARALARSLRPDEDPSRPPPWLLPHQIAGFRRVLAALKRYGGALLADPVGSGKTFIALAIARAFPRWPVTCLVPAPLVGQWRTIAARLGIAAVVSSHQQASRGRLPPSDRGLVIIDESHHFRHPNTKRYLAVAPWLVGRPTLLLTATPVVNRLSDLAAQLLLAVRSDAMAADGVISLRELLDEGRSSPALGRLIFEQVDAGERPRRHEHVSAASTDEDGIARNALAAIDRLRLSRHQAIARLIRGVLYEAMASSPAALATALRRYRTLLLHARDAATAGRTMDRGGLRRFIDGHEDQLVWWELLSDTSASTELELSDLQAIDDMIDHMERTREAADGKVDRLRATLADGRPTLIFVSRRATVRYLRGRLHNERVAWCTGERAGIGPTPLPRDLVWQQFGGAANISATSPRLLVTTDVAAEGLDLRRIERVVHYDLPHTPMRLEQREGRAVRLGSGHAVVEVIRFAPPRALEQRLRRVTTLTRKAHLPAAVGLGTNGGRWWRWRAELAERFEQGPAIAGIASVPFEPAGVLAGFAIGGSVATVLWLDRALDYWTEDPVIVSARLAQVAQRSDGSILRFVNPSALRDALARLADPVRLRMALAAGRRWAFPNTGHAARALTARLQQDIAATARQRNIAKLQHLEETLRFLAGGHTAGEEMLIEDAAARPEVELAGAMRRLPSRRPPALSLEVHLVGIVLFEPE